MEHNPSLEDRVKELARLLGIAVGEQLYRALEVGEKDREAEPVATWTPIRDPLSAPTPPRIPGSAGRSRRGTKCRGSLPRGLGQSVHRARRGDGRRGDFKLLPAGIELDDEIVPRLRAELPVTRAVARIRPNVAIVHDCDRTVDDRDFLVLEPLDGRSLADVRDRRRPPGRP